MGASCRVTDLLGRVAVIGHGTLPSRDRSKGSRLPPSCRLDFTSGRRGVYPSRVCASALCHLCHCHLGLWDKRLHLARVSICVIYLPPSVCVSSVCHLSCVCHLAVTFVSVSVCLSRQSVMSVCHPSSARHVSSFVTCLSISDRSVRLPVTVRTVASLRDSGTVTSPSVTRPRHWLSDFSAGADSDGFSVLNRHGARSCERRENVQIRAKQDALAPCATLRVPGRSPGARRTELAVFSPKTCSVAPNAGARGRNPLVGRGGRTRPGPDGRGPSTCAAPTPCLRPRCPQASVGADQSGVSLAIFPVKPFPTRSYVVAAQVIPGYTTRVGGPAVRIQRCRPR